MLRPTAVKAIALENQYLQINFDNGEIRFLNVAPFIKGSWYGKLADPVYFSRVRTDGFTVVWPDGQDLCPDDVYYLSTADPIL